MADDLRTIIASLKISNNLERIGDYAKNIAKRSITLSQTELLPGPLGVIRSMVDIVEDMIYLFWTLCGPGSGQGRQRPLAR